MPSSRPATSPPTPTGTSATPTTSPGPSRPASGSSTTGPSPNGRASPRSWPGSPGGSTTTPPRPRADAVDAFRADAARFATRTRALFDQYVGRPPPAPRPAAER